MVLRFLGNHRLSPHIPTETIKLIVGSIGFFGDAYDLFILNMAMVLWKSDDYSPKINSDEQSYLSTVAFAGAIAGQVSFGMLGDKFGVIEMWLLTSAIVIIASIASGLADDIGSQIGIYTVIAVCRFFLGIGIGGEYPLSATVASESHEECKGKSVSKVFSAQGVGMMAAPLLFIVLIKAGFSLDKTWRFALAFGAIPPLTTLYHRLQFAHAHNVKKLHLEGKSQHVASHSLSKHVHHTEGKSTLGAMLENKWTFVGTAMSWFMFDICFYANGVFNGTLLSHLGANSDYTDSRQHIVDVGFGSFMLALFGMPGYLVGIAFIGKVPLKHLQLAGFVGLTILFGFLALIYNEIENNFIFVFLYGLTFFLSNAGPNTTTFVIPAQVFPYHHRATLHGLSAAMGKLGAVIGGACLPSVLNAGGPRAVLMCSALACLGGGLVTHFFIPYQPAFFVENPMSRSQSRNSKSESEKEQKENATAAALKPDAIQTGGPIDEERQIVLSMNSHPCGEEEDDDAAVVDAMATKDKQDAVAATAATAATGNSKTAEGVNEVSPLLL